MLAEGVGGRGRRRLNDADGHRQHPWLPHLEIARVAFATPDVDLLCFGESDQPSPASAHAAAVAALDAGATRYPDVRGLPELRSALADYLTKLHARPVAEERIQITASGMTAVSVALAATVRAGDRVVLHSPSWPNVGNAARLRGAEVDELALTAVPDGGFQHGPRPAGRDAARCARLHPEQPEQSHRLDRHTRRIAAILEIARRRRVWLISDEVYSRLVYDGAPAAPSMLDIAEPRRPGDRLQQLLQDLGDDRLAPRLAGGAGGRARRHHRTGGGDAFRRRAVHPARRPRRGARHRQSWSGSAAHCATGRTLTGDALSGLNGVRYAAPDGAFYAFVGVEGLTDSLSLAKRLVTDHHVAVAPGMAFGAAGEGYLRICFAQSAERIERAMGRLRDGLREAA